MPKVKKKRKTNSKGHRLSKGKMLFAVGLLASLIGASAYGIWQYYEGQNHPRLAAILVLPQV